MRSTLLAGVVACAVQSRRTMLPMSDQEYGAIAGFRRSAPLSLAGFRVHADYEPAAEVGGDFYFVTARSATKLNVVIGDACGRGVSAASLVTRIGPEVRELVHSGASPSLFLSTLSAQISGRLPPDVFITAVCLQLDSERRTMVVANAGHVPPVVRRGDGSTRIVGRASGPPLGILGTVHYATEVMRLDVSDIIVLMTDGVLESFEQDLWHMHTLKHLLAEDPADSLSLNRKIMNELRVASSNGHEDDLTLVTIAFDEARWSDVPARAG